MNDWMCRDLKWDDSYQPDRGKVLTAEQIAALPKFNRYMDVDGDGIAARTLPGTHPKGAYFTRGSGHNMYGAYTEDAAEYQAVVDRLRRKFDTAKELVPAAGDPRQRQVPHRHPDDRLLRQRREGGAGAAGRVGRPA